MMAPAHYTSQAEWKILIVDDDEDVRLITQLVLKSIEFEGQRLRFYFADSGLHAVETMRQHPDMGVILMDSVMESQDAGFLAVQKIRNELNNHQTRIIMRTGRSEDDLEDTEFLRYDINGFREKTLSAKQLIFSVIGELRSYRDIRTAQFSRTSMLNKDLPLRVNN